MALDDLGPDLAGVAHLLLEWHGPVIEADRLDAEDLRKSRPQPPPAKDVTVDDVERRVRGCGRRGGPHEMIGEQPGVRDVRDRLHCSREPGK